MKIADFRPQTSVPDSPSAGVVGIYANASGALISLDSAGRQVQIGGQYTGSATNAQVITGGSMALTSGVVFSAPAAGGVVTGLANPTIWLRVLGVGNQDLVIPAYALR